MSPEDRKKLAGLLGFAEGVLSARTRVQMEMQSGLGVFHEHEVRNLPGVQLDCDDGNWFRIERQRETKPPEPVDFVSEFLVARPNDPNRKPQLKTAMLKEVSIEEASDLAEAGLLVPEDVRSIIENGIEVENRVKVILHSENLPEMRREFDRYLAGAWADWAAEERPVRHSISFYNDLFKLHAAIRTSEGTPPELVWGIGIARWKHPQAQVEMPLIEQLVDIEVEDGGAIVIRPRDVTPLLSLKAYLELEIDGAARLQSTLQERLAQLLLGDVEFSPFTTVWEPILDAAASNLSSSAVHVTREAMDAGDNPTTGGEHLRITSGWALFGRPRSNEARVQDLNALRKQVEDETVDVPTSIRGFAAPLPDETTRNKSDFGLDTNILMPGGGPQSWEPSATGGTNSILVLGAGDNTTNLESHKVHFFPLPFNEEQGRISDMIDDQSLQVACVSGPPGTGKSHSIANIISHQMAMGKRVLVTARTPEAISAVREKLPESLQPLVIASVGTDRESAQQLQDAVSELSREVVNLNVQEAQSLRAKLEQGILDCDKVAAEADRDLAEIARANLSQLTWKGTDCTPMELVTELANDAPTYGWFSDRPKDPPSPQVGAVVERLRASLPPLAADIIYAGQALPSLEELPTTNELILAHREELGWNTREIVDYSAAPKMARDGANAGDQARSLLEELEAIKAEIDQQPEQTRDLIARMVAKEGRIDPRLVRSAIQILSDLKDLTKIARVRFSRGNCAADDFLTAARRGAAEMKPVGFGFFNSSLKDAVGSVRVGDAPPTTAEDWRAVVLACQLEAERANIEKTLHHFVTLRLAPAIPHQPWELAGYIIEARSALARSLSFAERVDEAAAALRRLFPVGLNIDAILGALDFSDAIFALRGNLPSGYTLPEAIARLRATADKKDLPVY
ncbi:MAG: hypothetical protein KDM64_05550, partial [Verrucomicrobiae bacterium]|nr:hypothetical protein [Verrucomicrobiae bacterium]